MIPQNFFDSQEVEQVRAWFMLQDENIQIAALFEIAKLRIMDAGDLLYKLRFAHSERTKNKILSTLNSPTLSYALAIYLTDSEKFAREVKLEVGKLGTTRPDDFWKKCGVGRPKGRRP